MVSPEQNVAQEAQKIVPLLNSSAFFLDEKIFKLYAMK
jgi:hypothetical protein